jgi:hypothetical protein
MGMEIEFDPFKDRMSRDIRNSLSTAFVAELIQGPGHGWEAVARKWLERVDGPAYIDYIRCCISRYRTVADDARRSPSGDPKGYTAVLWNAGLFFELHELLESVWLDARGIERTALKGLIQAAGVYVHRNRGAFEAAARLAKRARENLRSGMDRLDFISGVESLIECIDVPSAPPPRLAAPPMPSRSRGA